MQIYLLAANLFAVAALLLGLGGFSGETRNRRLVPLFLLVISRSLALIISLVASRRDSAMTPAGLGALEVFSTFLMAWILTGPTSRLPGLWPKLAWAGGGGAVLLSILSLLPGWPIPPEIHSLAIAVFSAPLILISLGQLRWSYLATPLILALANFLILLGLTSVSWLISLWAYAFLINAIHLERLQAYYQIYRERQKAAEALVQEAISLNQEQQRWFEVSQIINNVPNLNLSLEHITQSMARAIQADQSAIFMLDTSARDRARLVILYSPERPLHITESGGIFFSLANCPPLQEALESQRPVLLPQSKTGRSGLNGLEKLYGLWREKRLGPTLIQPLVVQGQPVGALMLGNPVSKRPLRERDVRLCQALALQIATLVEYRRRYLELEAQAEVMAAAGTKQAKPAVAIAVSEPSPPVLSASEVNQPGEFEVYQAIFETISDGVVVSDTRGRVRLVNRAAERILGKSVRELLGQPIGAIYGQIDMSEPIDDLVVAFARRNQPLPTFKETADRAIQGRLVPWRNVDYEWLGIIAVFRDVTREVKADQARNDFIAALSRELRGPLTAIKGYSELISQGAMSGYSPQQIRIQQIIHSSAGRMVEVLDNAIQISVENRAQVLPRFEETDVTQVINETLREITPLAQLRELSLNCDIKGDLPPIMADPAHLHRMLSNLLSNACHFTPPGGQVTLRAWLQSEREGNTSRSHLLLAVADNGIGIPPTEAQRIFDPFYQLNPQSLEEYQGMGMGLAVVKELVELHNGRVWVESMPGKGSVFQIALPLLQEY